MKCHRHNVCRRLNYFKKSEESEFKSKLIKFFFIKNYY